MFCCITLLLRAQDNIHLNSRSDTVNYLIQQIAHDPSVSIYSASIIPVYSIQFYRVTCLFSIITNDEMVGLAKNGHGAIRVFSYMGLYLNKSDQLELIKELLKNDSSEVIDTQGCLIKKTTVGKVIMGLKEPCCQHEMNLFLLQIKNNEDFRKAVFESIASSN